MRELLPDSDHFALLLSLAAYGLGLWLRKKTRLSVCNPLLLAVVVTMLALPALDVPYEAYRTHATFLSDLLTPATVCLAIPLYEQLPLLRRSWRAICAGIAAGVAASAASIWGMARLFRFSAAEFATFLPKSITTAIGMDVSASLGGVAPLTVAAIVLTGILGSLLGPPVLRLLRVRDPVARGVALGSASHAVGTSRALELGQIEGAMSGLALVLSGLATALLAPLFAYVY